MNKLQITSTGRGHSASILHDLIRFGWSVDSISLDGRIPRNGMKISLKLDDREVRIRILAYKITTSGRSRPHERRVEITTTYKSGLAKAPGYRDVVLGIDTAGNKYVGIDSRRLNMGGDTHNASSFFDLEGLSVKAGGLLVNPRSVTSSLFPQGIEQHAFFDGSRLADYLFNHQEIHSGLYSIGIPLDLRIVPHARVQSAMDLTYEALGDAFVLSAQPQSRRKSGRVSQSDVAAYENGDLTRIRKRTMTPEQLRILKNYCDEIGAIGEQAVLKHERKRLRLLGFHDLANRVKRVSLLSVSEGYDILSFESDGITERYLEVKATSLDGLIVDISLGEWRAAHKFRERYYIVRVIHAKESPTLLFIRDPAQLLKQGLVARTPSGWKVDLRTAARSSTAILLRKPIA